MAQVVQAKCPLCKHVLRIPSAWLTHSMRCKHCHQVFRTQESPAVAAAKPAAPFPVARPQALPLRRPRSRARAWWVGILLFTCVAGTGAFIWLRWGEDLLNLAASPEDSKPPQDKTKHLVLSGDSKTKTRPDEKNSGKPDPKAVRDPHIPRDGKNPDQPITDKNVVNRPEPNKDRPIVKDAVSRDRASKDGDKSAPINKKDLPREAVKAPGSKDGPGPMDKPPADQKVPRDSGTKPRTTPAEFPRRALLISVNNYLYANPLAYGAKDMNTGTLFQDFQRRLHVPPSQILELSDGARRAQAPVKPVMEQVISDFLAGSRPMDRIVLFFSGHAVEIGKEPYLVPLEGNLSDPKTLIKLSWVYDRLARCPARQKVLIIDVCRFNLLGGQERQGTGSMGAVLDAALATPPAGVQVWSSCVAKQQSHEVNGGSLFIEALCGNLQHGLKGIPLPSDPLPMELLNRKVQEYMDPALKEKNLQQTCRLAGKDPGTGAEYDPDRELPAPLVVRAAPSIRDLVTDPAEVQLILDEIDGIPPARGGNPRKLRAGALPTFPAKIMKKYQVEYKSVSELDARLAADPKGHALIRAVRNATGVLERNGQRYRNNLMGKGLPNPPQLKTRIEKEQQQVSKDMLALLEALETLKKAAEKRDEEDSQHWQANYDYVLTRLIARVVYLREWSLMMGKIRKDELPDLAGGDTGWRLVGSAKLQSKDSDIKDMMKERKKALDRLVKKRAGTPWEVLARREEAANLGLEWKPNSAR